MYNNMYGKKSTNKISIAITILIILVLAVSVCYLIIRNKKGKETLLYSTWICQENLEIAISDDFSVEIYNPMNKSILDIIGTYTIDSKEKTDDNIKYNITVTSNDMTSLGEKLTTEYVKQIVIDIDSKTPTTMKLEYSPNNFTCEKK